jgi:hypothetical protein
MCDLSGSASWVALIWPGVGEPFLIGHWSGEFDKEPALHVGAGTLRPTTSRPGQRA